MRRVEGGAIRRGKAGGGVGCKSEADSEVKEMRKGFAILVSVLCLIALVASTAAAQAKFGLNDIPTIKNKKAMNLIIETGDAHGKTIPAIEEFTKKTGVKVNVERVASSGVYGKENGELLAGTGFYDLVYVEPAWTTELSDYLV